MPSSLRTRAPSSQPASLRRAFDALCGASARSAAVGQGAAYIDCLGRYASPDLPCAATAVACVFRAARHWPVVPRAGAASNGSAAQSERCVAALDYQFPGHPAAARFSTTALDLREVLAERLLQSPRKRRGIRPDFIVPGARFQVSASGARLQPGSRIAKSLGRRLRLRVEPELVLRLRDTSARRPSWT